MDEITEECYKSFLQKHHVKFVSVIDLERQFLLSYLRSTFVLDDEDCERILFSGPTRQTRVTKLLDILACKGVEGCKLFVAGLEFEYPLLYEKLTGNKAGSRRSFIKQHALLDSGEQGLRCKKELGDLERQLMVKRLECVSRELLDTSYGYQKVIEEKRACENEVAEFRSELQSKDRYIENLEEQLQAQERSRNDSDNSVHFQDIRNIHLENIQKDRIIIQLQNRVICMNEEVSKLKKDQEELFEKNDSLMSQVRDLTISYDSERRNSKILNETVKSQSHELNRTKCLERQLLDTKYQLCLSVEEKDLLLKDFEEFRKWTEILNSRFDVVCFQKDGFMEVSDEVSQKYASLCNTVYALETKLHDRELKTEFYQQANNRLTKEVDLRVQEKQMILKKLETVVDEREAAFADRDKAVREISEIQMNHECEVKEQAALYERVKKELSETRDALENVQKECLELKKQAADATSEIDKYKRMDSGSSRGSLIMTSEHKEKNNQEKEEVKVDGRLQSPIGSSIVSPKTRCPQELLNSIRRKVNDDSAVKFSSLPAGMGGFGLIGPLSSLVCKPLPLFVAPPRTTGVDPVESTVSTKEQSESESLQDSAESASLKETEVLSQSEDHRKECRSKSSSSAQRKKWIASNRKCVSSEESAKGERTYREEVLSKPRSRTYQLDENDAKLFFALIKNKAS